MSDAPKGLIRTEFCEIYAAQSGRYEAAVQYRDASNGAAAYVFRINGTSQGDEWEASADDNAWKSHPVKDVFLCQGDVIEVEVRPDGRDRGELDFVQLTYLWPDDPAAMPGQIIVDPAERMVAVTAGDQAWPEPPEIGPEAALYIKRLDGVAPPELK